MYLIIGLPCITDHAYDYYYFSMSKLVCSLDDTNYVNDSFKCSMIVVNAFKVQY